MGYYDPFMFTNGNRFYLEWKPCAYIAELREKARYKV